MKKLMMIVMALSVLGYVVAGCAPAAEGGETTGGATAGATAGGETAGATGGETK